MFKVTAKKTIMLKSYRQGAVGALLDIYEQAIVDLTKMIKDIPDQALPVIIDEQTTDENCKSIQTILSHVVHAGYGYATTIYNSKRNDLKRPQKTFRSTVQEYTKDLSAVFSFTENVFKEISDSELEQPDNTLKMVTG